MRAANSNNKFEGFVLTGGKSSRMKTDKAFLKFNGETFLERAFKTLSPICEGRVKIVLNQNQSPENFSSFTYVRDIFPERGALGGIHAALVNSKSEWTIVLACDLPLVINETISDLSKIALDSAIHTAAIVPKQSDGRIQPLCAFYRSVWCLPRLEKLLQTENSASVRDFLNLISTAYTEINKPTFLNESPLFNVNTPEDYKHLKKD